MPEIAGTIPAVKERPKVTRRPTIPAPTAPQRQPPAKENLKSDKRAAEKVSLASGNTDKHIAGAEAHADSADFVPEMNPRLGARPSFSGSCATVPTSGALGVTPAHVDAPMMPVKKLLVKASAEAKRGVVSAKVAPTMPAKKPLVTKRAKLAAEAAKPRVAKASNQSRWAPLAVGIALGSLAPAIYALAALWDPWGLRIVFPFVQLAGLHEFGISHELTRTLPQVMLYLQFPLEGLLVGSNLRRGMKLSSALGPIPGLHFAAGLVLWIVALGSMPPV